MSYQPAGVYQPDHWVIASHDPKYGPQRTGNTSITSNTAWVANLAVYVPIWINRPGTIFEWFHFNGTLTTAHNLDFGLYNPDFTKVQTLGSTAGGTVASALNNTTTWTNLDVAPGPYYMAFADDSTRNITTSGDVAGLYQAMGMMEQTSSSFPLPATATPIAYTRAFLPYFGFTMRTITV